MWQRDSDEDAKTVLAGSEKTSTGEELEYWWFAGNVGFLEGAIVVRIDRFGQRWQLQLDRASYVTVRVAAGLLDVTPMTVTNWLRSGVFPRAKTISKATVIPLRDVERAARARGIPLPFAE